MEATGLIKFDQARQALMEAKTVDEVKDIRDKAEALRLYLKQQGESLEMQNAYAEIKLRAERRAGELLREMPKAPGGQPYQNGNSTGDTMSLVEDVAPTLAEIGVTPKQSSRFQTIASIPEEVFEAHITKFKATQKELTSASMRRLANELRQQEAKTIIIQAAQEMPIALPDAIQFYYGDFINVCPGLEPASVDAIITDPPYNRENLPLYEALARQSAHLLKPGGSLLVMCGQSYLPEIFNLMTPHLAYHWTLSYLTPGGQSPQIWPRKVNTFWKPIIWFVKDNYEGDWHGDVIKSDVNDNDKRFHHWGQSESGIFRLVENFSKPGDLILDPFLGGGTTALAAFALNRRFIGIDIDEQAIEITKGRIANYANER